MGNETARIMMQIRFGSHSDCWRAIDTICGPIRSAPYFSANAL